MKTNIDNETEYVVHPSARDDIHLKLLVARGFHHLTGDLNAGGEFEVFVRDGRVIGVRHNGKPISLDVLTPTKFAFYVNAPLVEYCKERRNIVRLNKGEVA